MKEDIDQLFDLSDAFDVSIRDMAPIAQIITDEIDVGGYFERMLPDEYRIINTSDVIVSADVYIIEDAILDEKQDDIQEQKDREDPVFLPCILLHTHNHPFREGTFPEDPIFDEIIQWPNDKGIIDYRMSGLIQRRKRGLELIERIATLEDINDTLNRRNEVISVLQRILRHNIRNDISVILGFLDMLEGELKEDADLSVLKTAKDTARDLSELSDKTRALTEEVSESKNAKTINVRQIIKDIIDSTEESYPEANVSINGSLDEAISVHPSLRTVLNELVDNACKHSENPSVEINIRREGDDVGITISDNGPGIPEYEQVTLSKGEEGALEHGSGVGLWLVGWIFREYHGGPINIQSNDDGTDIEIILPDVIGNGHTNGEDENTKSATSRP